MKENFVQPNHLAFLVRMNAKPATFRVKDALNWSVFHLHPEGKEHYSA